MVEWAYRGQFWEIQGGIDIGTVCWFNVVKTCLMSLPPYVIASSPYTMVTHIEMLVGFSYSNTRHGSAMHSPS